MTSLNIVWVFEHWQLWMKYVCMHGIRSESNKVSVKKRKKHQSHHSQNFDIIMCANVQPKCLLTIWTCKTVIKNSPSLIKPMHLLNFCVMYSAFSSWIFMAWWQVSRRAHLSEFNLFSVFGLKWIRTLTWMSKTRLTAAFISYSCIWQWFTASERARIDFPMLRHPTPAVSYYTMILWLRRIALFICKFIVECGQIISDIPAAYQHVHVIHAERMRLSQQWKEGEE